jgi:sarcosine oxidase, subunit beta
MQTADVVIIGGGVVGASVAYHLAERGCANVVVVEREAEQGRGSTGRATGGVRAQFASPLDIRMSLYSVEFFARFREATGRGCGYDPVGYLFLAADEAQMDSLRSAREMQRAEGLTGVEILDRAEIARRVPLLRVDDLAGGSFCQTDGLIAPLAVMRGLTARAVERGARVWTETEVTGIELEGGRVSAVRTSRGTVSTRAAVNCAGAWAAHVARMAGVELPVFPLRRQLAGFRTRGPLPAGLPMVIELGTGFHFRPVARGAGEPPDVLLAWPDPGEPPGFNTDFDPAFAEEVLRRAVRRAPCFDGAELRTELCRAGLYEMTPDRHPVICESRRARGLFLANGFSGHGVMHSPATGRAVADLVLDGRTQLFDLSPLDAERFETGKLLDDKSLL